jgi:uncharacterized protein (TIGR02596 family)
MNTTRSFGFRPPGRSAYTLFELVAVMAIMALLLVLILPSIGGINESNNINSGGQLFADQVALARQIASSRNITVEVRCINIPARSQFGYTGIQLWSSSSGTPVPVSRMQTLPDGITISKDTTQISSLFLAYQKTGTMPVTTPTSGDTYVSFTINPSGMVGPLTTTTAAPNMTTLTVGVLPVRFSQNTTLPVNYMLVQLNPVTGATLNYRP